jgi:phosphoglycerate dehydrogenase-like enzyme
VRIVVPDRISLKEEQVSELKKRDVAIFEDVPKSRHEIIKRIKNAEIITANYIDIDKSIIDACPMLKYIVVPAVGYDWVDVDYAASKGIGVVNCPTHNASAVAEYAIGLLFAVTRRIAYANGSLARGGWSPTVFTGVEVSGKRLGLIGYGNIGENIERLAIALNMEVVYVNSKSTQEEIDRVIAVSDFVIVCAQLNERTRHIINTRRLALMNNKTYLINVGRGGLIDQAALITALRSNKLGGVALDVFEGEPLVGEPSEEIVALAQMPNVVATPHIAYNTEESVARLGVELMTNLEAILDGSPKNLVNR